MPEEKDKLRKKTKPMTAAERLKEFSETSGMHGLVKFTMNISVARVIMWAVLLFLLGGICIWQLVSVFMQYFAYETSTSVGITYSKQNTFPAVTVCNMNPLRKNDLSNLPPTNSLKVYMDSIVNMNTGFTGPKFSGSFDWNNVDQSSQRTDFNTKQDFYSHFMSLTEDEMLTVGSTISNMLLDCSYNGITCSPQNFTWFPNAVFGNCYTFNIDSSGSYATADSVGPLYGLSLTIAIDQDEYVHQLAESAGIKMIVHDQSRMPFPEDEGLIVSPGTYTQVGITRLEITRAEPPYGRCQPFTTDEITARVAYLDLLPTGYTSKACDYTCTQEYVAQDCNCLNPLFPGSNTSLIAAVSSGQGYCFLSNVSDTQCIEGVKQKAHSREYSCETKCPPACSAVDFRTSVTAALWPADAKLDGVLHMIGSVNVGLNNKITALPPGDRAGYIAKNLVKVDVFYETLDYNTMTTTAAYGTEEFLSDFGGTVELWLGLSIVTFFEVCEVIFDIVKMAYLKRKIKSNKTADSGEDEMTVVDT